MEPGTPIDLGVAELERVTVPNLVGRDGTDVDRWLARAELLRGQIRREESRQPEGTVVSQEPAANTRVPIATAVDLVVAVPVTALVPNLVGRVGADAGRLLVDAELRRGRVRREESRQLEGTVLSQSPAASERGRHRHGRQPSRRDAGDGARARPRRPRHDRRRHRGCATPS